MGFSTLNLQILLFCIPANQKPPTNVISSYYQFTNTPRPKKERKVKVSVSSLYLNFYSANSIKRNHRGTQIWTKKRYRKESRNLQAAVVDL